LQLRRADHGDEPEEDKDEELAEAVVAVGERAPGIGECGQDRSDAESYEDGPAERCEPAADDTGGDQNEDYGSLELADRDQSSRRDAGWPESLRRVGTSPEVREIVGEIGTHLQKQRHRHAAKSGIEPEGRARCPGRSEPDHDPTYGRRQSRRPNSQ